MEASDRLERRMKLHDLRVLIAVVEAGSMGKAAQRLHTCQPAISRSIAELERLLGVRLLDRHPQGVQPTRYGRALLDCGSAVFDDLRRGLESIRFLADPTAGEVRIGCNPFLAASFVAAVIDRLARQHPRIVFSVTAAPVDVLRAQLRERKVDLLVTRKGDAVIDEGMAFRPLFDDSFVVAGGARHPLARRRKVTLAQLAGEPWVLPPPESVIGSVVGEAFARSGLPVPRARVVAVPLEARLSLLASGRFVTIFPSSALKLPGRMAGVRVLPVRLAVRPVTNGIVTLADRTLSPVARLFVDAAREASSALAKA